MMQEHIEALDDEVLGVAHRLRAARHVQAARRGALQLPRQSRAADAHPVSRMSFLAPLFFVGLAAIAVPIFVHLIQRERKNIVEFPSLMFLRQHSVPVGGAPPDPQLAAAAAAAPAHGAARRGVLAAVLRRRSRAGRGGRDRGAREVVILLDRSASMGYGDHWARAQDEAQEDRRTTRRRGPGDARPVRHGRRRGRARRRPIAAGSSGAIDAAKVSSDGTRYAPGAAARAEPAEPVRRCRARRPISSPTSRESGWERQEEIHLPEGATLTPVSVADAGHGGPRR